MLVGLMSDSHDHQQAVRAAVKVFSERHVEFVLHAGDHVAPFTVRRYEELGCDWLGVFGNNDGERRGLEKISRGRIRSETQLVELDGVPILVAHTLEQGLEFVDGLPEPPKVLVCGHTHQAGRFDRRGMLVVNPGEVCGYLTGRATVALLDTQTLEVDFLDLPLSGPCGP